MNNVDTLEPYIVFPKKTFKLNKLQIKKINQAENINQIVIKSNIEI